MTQDKLTEACQDEQVGIKKQWAKILEEHGVFDIEDELLAATVSSGGVCPECKNHQKTICPMCLKECNKNDNQNYVHFSYNYFREWRGDSDDGSWVKPSRYLLCSKCSDKYCDYRGESHLYSGISFWVFKTRKGKVDTDLHKYKTGLWKVMEQKEKPSKDCPICNGTGRTEITHTLLEWVELGMER